jgi:hypothetical protein
MGSTRLQVPCVLSSLRTLAKVDPPARVLPPSTYIDDPTETAVWWHLIEGKGAAALHESLDGVYFSTLDIHPLGSVLKPPVI